MIKENRAKTTALLANHLARLGLEALPNDLNCSAYTNT
jgi:hypothetical protein